MNDITGAFNDNVEPDEDFRYFKMLLDYPDSKWELGLNMHHSGEAIKVYKLQGFCKDNVMIKCEAILPKIPKFIAFEALADINIRKKWDEVIGNLTIIEENLT